MRANNIIILTAAAAFVACGTDSHKPDYRIEGVPVLTSDGWPGKAHLEIATASFVSWYAAYEGVPQGAIWDVVGDLARVEFTDSMIGDRSLGRYAPTSAIMWVWHRPGHDCLSYLVYTHELVHHLLYELYGDGDRLHELPVWADMLDWPEQSAFDVSCEAWQSSAREETAGRS